MTFSHLLNTNIAPLLYYLLTAHFQMKNSSTGTDTQKMTQIILSYNFFCLVNLTERAYNHFIPEF